MARVTVEDCVEEIPNRFELVVLAAQRAKNIASGAPITIDRDNDKNPVIALREIASGNLDADTLREAQISSLQTNNKVDEILEENLYAEAKESIGEEVDYSEDSDVNAADDLFLKEPDVAQDAEMDFSDNVSDEDK